MANQIHSALMHQRSIDFISLFAGACLIFAFTPFAIGYIAWLAPAGLFWSWQHATPKRASWRGLLFGIGFFSGSVSWIFISIHRYGNTHILIAALVTTFFILLLSLAPAISGYVIKRFYPNITSICSLFAVPSIWVLLEFMRSYLFSGFPWVLLGQSQLHTPLQGFIPIVGIYGVSWLCIFIGMCLLLCYRHKTLQYRMTLMMIIVIINVIGYGLQSIHWTTPIGSEINVGLVQGNITPDHKWDQQRIHHNIEQYQNLSQPLWKQSQLLIWPENAIAIPNTQAMHLLMELHHQAVKTNTLFIAGLPITNPTSYYNGALALGKQIGSYLKRHLVPFGEYVPFGDSLRGIVGFLAIPMSDFTPGSMQQLPIMLDDYTLGVFICYEIAYASLVRHSAKQTNVLILLSDDSWFGRSVASQQQLEIAQVRALETGRYVLSATNTGQTAVINPQGHIRGSTPAYEANVLQTTFQMMQGNTPWLSIGIMPILIGCILCVFITAILQQRRRKSHE